MSVFDVLMKMKSYIENCPTDNMKEAALKDFIEGIQEIIDIGYTWGRIHPLPLSIKDIRGLSEEDLGRLLKMLGNG
jgi:hypothetical protein